MRRTAGIFRHSNRVHKIPGWSFNLGQQAIWLDPTLAIARNNRCRESEGLKRAPIIYMIQQEPRDFSKATKPRRAEDIAFVINPSLWHNAMYPSGILCLSSYLELHGFPNIIMDSRSVRKKLSQQQREDLLIEKLREIRPRIICFSSTHREYDEVIRLNNKIRALDESMITIVGGSQPTYRTSDFLDNGFDFVCVGEGERTLLQFAEEALGETARWSTVNGLAWKHGDAVAKNGPRKLLDETELNFDVISAYEKIDPRYFDFGVEIVRGLPLVGGLLLTTRGCPYNCSFCGCNLIFGRKVRYRPIEAIRREVSYLVSKRHVEGIWILDDTFTINKEHAIEVADVLKSYQVIWGCQSRVDSLTESFVSDLRARGCRQMDFGVESGSQRILDEIIGKKTKVEDVNHAIKIASAKGIRTLANFIIGFPTESPTDLNATKSLADNIDADVYVFSIATPLPGTRLYEMVGEEIHPSEYSLLNWNGSDLTERLNKSTIPNVVQERRRLKHRYLWRSVYKSVCSIPGLKFLFSRDHRIKRIQASAEFLVRTLRGT